MRVALLLPLALAGCNDPNGAHETAALHGFEDVVIDGYALGRCGERDTYSTPFHARGAKGQCFAGVVCSGWMKGATLRVLGPSDACGRQRDRSGDKS